MRIQHNIMAMNSYRNYMGNSGALGKNLEKLSSGYRINRAGDDAAGLAISEKMRAQISGLDAAQKNVQDGISLVKTAEGALQEVQDMLNRMEYLATQSANGTYDNTVDRANLQKEVQALKSEIDRIADSSNFNGINLLDGSMEQGGLTAVELSNLDSTTTAGTANDTALANAVTGELKEGETMNLNLACNNGITYNVSLTMKKGQLVDNNTGKAYSVSSTYSATSYDEALKDAIETATAGDFTATVASGVITSIKSTVKGTGAPQIIGATSQKIAADGTANASAAHTATYSAEAKAEYIVAEGTANVTGLDKSSTIGDIQKNVFEINGQKFALVKTEADMKAVEKAADGMGINLVFGAKVGAAAGQLAAATGLKITAQGDKIKIETDSGNALNLQIGDSAKSYNRMAVEISDMHVSSLGIAGLSVGNQTDAAVAVDMVKKAINSVSTVRGNLGAIQNRLEHTANNLSVMEENITNAESAIRDTDIADEMTQYTKNNILLQSAQAMLAQANQVPQGVLQLLQ